MSIFRVGQDIGDVNSFAFEQSASHDRAAAGLYRQSPEVLDKLGRVAVRLGTNQLSVFLAGDGGEVGAAKPGSRFDECLQNRFQIERRPADHLEHVGGGGLLLERFSEVARAHLYLVEQPHVLDRDQRLVGESGDELDLPVRERLDVIALETDDGDHYAVAQQRSPEHGALPADLLGLQHVVLGISQAIRQVNRFSLNRGSADQRAASRCYRMLKEVFDIVGPDVVGPHQVVFAVLQLEEKGMFRLAQARRCLQDCINDWLQLVGRARDDVQHVADRRLIFERFLHLARARLHLVEESRILDRDYRLVGEGLQQCDLLVTERLNNRTPQQEAADGTGIAHKWNTKSGSVSQLTRNLNAQRKFVAGRGKVEHMDHLLIQDGAPRHPASLKRSAARADRHRTMMRRPAQFFTLA